MEVSYCGRMELWTKKKTQGVVSIVVSWAKNYAIERLPRAKKLRQPIGKKVILNLLRLSQFNHGVFATRQDMSGGGMSAKDALAKSFLRKYLRIENAHIGILIPSFSAPRSILRNLRWNS